MSTVTRKMVLNFSEHFYVHFVCIILLIPSYNNELNNENILYYLVSQERLAALNNVCIIIYFVHL